MDSERAPARLSPAPAFYLAGKFSSQLGQNALLAALLVTAGTSKDASIGLSSFLLAMLVPSVLLGPIGGAIVDRLSPSVGYTVGATLRALAIVPAFFLIGTPHLVWVVAACYSAASQVFTPAEFALVHDVQGKKPGRIYSGLTVLQYAGQGAGIMLFAPALFFLGGQPAVFLGVVAVFTVVALIGLMISAAVIGNADEPVPARSAFSFGTVARFLFTNSHALNAVVALTLAGIITRVLVISLPGYVRDEVNIGPLGMLCVVVPGVLGLVTGLFVTSRLLSLERSGTLLRLASLGLLVGLGLLAFVDNGVTLVARNSYIPAIKDGEAWLNTTAIVAVPGAFAGGFGLCMVVMSARFVLTELAPFGSRGRVHAVQLAITETLLVGPVLLAGVATALAGARLTLTVSAIVAVLVLAITEWRRMTQPAAATPLAAAPEPLAAPLRPAD
jgi:hypothetical protein